MKKGDFEWDTIAKFILLFIVLLIILLIIGLFKGGLDKAIQDLSNLFGA